MVKAMVWGFIAAVWGAFLCSFTIYDPMYRKIGRRVQATRAHKWIVVGMFLMGVGVVIGAFGGSCLDNTIFWVDDCPREYMSCKYTK
jgi:MFS family permease